MKKSIIIASTVALLLSGCQHIRTATGNMVYPISKADFAKDTKTGEVCISPLFYELSDTDYSVKAAAISGGVSKVKYVEIKSSPLQQCTVVYGE